MYPDDSLLNRPRGKKKGEARSPPGPLVSRIQVRSEAIGMRHARKLACMAVLFVLGLLVGLPAVAAFLSKTSLLTRALTTSGFDIGAPVVYQRQEISNHPVANALNI